MATNASRRRIALLPVPVLAALACVPMHAAIAQDSAATAAVRTIESLRRDEMLRLRMHDTPLGAAPILGRLRRRAGDTLWIVPEPPRPKPLFHRGTPAPYAVPGLATLDVGRRVRGGRESVNRGARQGLVGGVVGFALLFALAGADRQAECVLLCFDGPWHGAGAGAITGVAIGPVIGAVVGGARTSWRWQPVAIPR